MIENLKYLFDLYLKYYTKWKGRHIKIRQDGTLTCLKDNGTVKHIVNLSTFLISIIEVTDSTSQLLQNKIGVKVECKRSDPHGSLSTTFRCLLSRENAMDLCIAAREISKIHNINLFLDSLKPTNEEYLLRPSLRLQQNEDRGTERMSNMRFTIGRVLDMLEKFDRKQMILSRRGAFKFLPVYFSNDLVHGSWWFVVGSLFITVISIFVLLSTYYQTPLGTDDSILSILEFRVAWILLIISGVFFTIGSLAFVRCMNDPPIKPVFTWYHIASDELLGSWFFFFGVFPAIPYSIIFLHITRELLYLGMLLVSLFCLAGTGAFVHACYPSQNLSREVSLRL